MCILPISEELKAKIAEAIAEAKKTPLTREQVNQIRMERQKVIKLGDRPPEMKRPESQHVDMGNGFRASVSFEDQPIGLCKHVSVSVQAMEALPPASTLFHILEAFGFHIPGHGVRWIEEWQPNFYAVHYVDVDDPSQRFRAVEDAAVEAAVHQTLTGILKKLDH